MVCDPEPASADAMTELVLLIFRVNGRLLLAGDQLVGPLGLTSARWQVLGSIVAAGRPQPVAWLARDMGVTRQNVQRIVNDLAREGVVGFEPNPHHRRAQLVLLTNKGQHLYQRAIKLQHPWATSLAEDLNGPQLAVARDVLNAVLQRLHAPL